MVDCYNQTMQIAKYRSSIIPRTSISSARKIRREATPRNSLPFHSFMLMVIGQLREVFALLAFLNSLRLTGVGWNTGERGEWSR